MRLKKTKTVITPRLRPSQQFARLSPFGSLLVVLLLVLCLSPRPLGYAQQKAKPAKSTHLPAAVVTTLHGLGNGAFAALQESSSAGISTDLMTVVVREHNVLVTSVLEGDSGKGGYGPVDTAQLQAGAEAAAKDVLAKLK